MEASEDDILRRYVIEAGDPAVRPGVDHVARLRSTLLDQLGPARKRRVFPRRLVAASIAAAMVGLVAWSMLGRPAIAWAQVGQALQGRPWVHTRTVGPDGTVIREAWFGTRSGIVAFRHGNEAEYEDERLGVISRYVPAEGVVYRLPRDDRPKSRDQDYLHQLLEGKGPATSPIPGMEVVDEVRRDILVDDRRWLEVELSLRVIAANRPLQKFRLRVDPVTKLPGSSAVRSDDGVWWTTTIDYPPKGPADLHDIGVPRTATVIDRMPSDDLNRLLAGLKAGRNRFDDYTGFVLDVSPMDGVNRVYRQGNKWRAEMLVPLRKNKPIPDGADVAWWKAHQGDYTFTPQAICDGKMIWYYRMKADRFDLDAAGPPAVSMTMRMEVSPPDDDPMMPWPHLLAEQLGHPSIWHPSHDRAFLVEPKPDDGPPGIVRVRVFNPQIPEAGRADLYRLWIDPDRTFLAIRAETSVFQGGANPPRVEFVDTKIVEDVARSPGGYWYPTRVRRKTSNFEGEQVSRFLLDFDAPVPDSLFLPLSL